MMEFYDVVEKRRTVRQFSSQPVAREKVERILEAGLKAPTYNHLREWDFILVHDDRVRLDITLAEGIPERYDPQQLQNVFRNHDPLAKDMYVDALPRQKKMILTAPELLVIVFKPKTSVIDSKKIYDLNCLASVWCCIENMLLAMAEEDLFGVTYIPQQTDAVKQVLGIPPHLEVPAIIPFGYKDDQALITKQNDTNLQDKIHYDRW